MRATPHPRMARGFLVAAVCGLISLLVVFVVVPWLPSMPDPAWIAVDLLAPAALALLLGGFLCPTSALYLWLGLPIQYLLLFLFRGPLAGNLGISLRSLGSFEYFFAAAIWPLGTTLVQFLALFLWEKVVRNDTI